MQIIVHSCKSSVHYCMLTHDYVKVSNEMRTSLDAIDLKILAILRADGRISNAELAKAVSLSPSACLRRLRALEANGTIRGYTALIETGGDNTPTVILVSISLERQTEAFMRRFEAAVRKSPEIKECYLMTGSEDYSIRLEAQSLADYERIHNDVLARLPGVLRIQSSFAIRTIVRPAG